MKEREWDFPPSSSTHRISTLKRHTNHNNTSSHGFRPEDYVALLARTRLLQDELLSEKYKLQAVERKGHQNILFIEELELLIDQQRTQLDLANKQIQRQVSRDQIIKEYEMNLREIGLEIASLNQILEKKNKQSQNLIKINTELKREQQDYERKLRTINTHRSKEWESLSKIMKLLDIDKEASFAEEMNPDLYHIEKAILEMKEKMDKLKSNFEGKGQEYSESMLKTKEKIISLEYALKLSEQRNQDLEKKKMLENSFAIDKKIEDVIEEMLKKEDDLAAQVIELQNQNEELRGEIENERSSLLHNYASRQRKLEMEVKSLREEVDTLRKEKQELEIKMSSFTSRSEFEVSRYRTEEHEMSKKYRQCQEENKRLRLLIIELESDKQMLEKEISVRMEDGQ